MTEAAPITKPTVALARLVFRIIEIAVALFTLALSVWPIYAIFQYLRSGEEAVSVFAPLGFIVLIGLAVVCFFSWFNIVTGPLDERRIRRLSAIVLFMIFVAISSSVEATLRGMVWLGPDNRADLISTFPVAVASVWIYLRIVPVLTRWIDVQRPRSLADRIATAKACFGWTAVALFISGTAVVKYVRPIDTKHKFDDLIMFAVHFGPLLLAYAYYRINLWIATSILNRRHRAAEMALLT